MVTHMKTTIEISDDLMARSRRLLKQQGGTFRALLEEGLALALKARAGRRKSRITPVTFAGQGLQEPMRGQSWERIRDTIYPHDRG
jgi:hypothetical protein